VHVKARVCARVRVRVQQRERETLCTSAQRERQKGWHHACARVAGGCVGAWLRACVRACGDHVRPTRFDGAHGLVGGAFAPVVVVDNVDAVVGQRGEEVHLLVVCHDVGAKRLRAPEPPCGTDAWFQ